MAGALGRKRVLITRAPGQSGRLRDALLAAGAVPVGAPAIQILDPEDWAELDRVLAAVGSYDWLLFTSQSAVDRVCDRLVAVTGGQRAAVGTGLALGLRIAAVGEATAARLRERGLPVHLTPADARGDGLAAALRPHVAQGARLLLPRGDLADQRLPDSLRAAGCQVESVIAYRTAPATKSDPALIAECRQGLDWVILTSGSTVTGLLALLGGEVPQALAPNVKIAVLGPETAKAAQTAGLAVDLVAPTATVEALVKAMDNQ